MARGIGATLGSATTDKFTSNVTFPAGVFSFHCWQNLRSGNTGGGGGLGRVFDASAVSSAGFLVFTQNGTYWNLFSFFSTGGQWITNATTAPIIPPSATWTALGVSYDPSSTANDPILWDTNTKRTVGNGGLARFQAPVGTYITPGVFYVGNRNAGDRNYDGMLAEVGLWNAILTDGEFAALAAGVSPLMIRPQSLVEHIPMLRDNVSSKLAAPTLTGTAVQPHPRIIMPRPQQRRRLATAAAFKAAWSRASNLPVLGTGNL